MDNWKGLNQLFGGVAIQYRTMVHPHYSAADLRGAQLSDKLVPYIETDAGPGRAGRERSAKLLCKL